MVHTAETNQTTASAAAAAAGTGKNESADPDIFAKELSDKTAGSGTSAKDRIAQSMEKLAAAFPGVTVTTRSMSGFGQTASYYGQVAEDASINISPQMMEQIAESEDLFSKIQDIIANLLSAGSQQNLVNAGGDSTHRNITASESEVRYVEVQRDANGSQLSVSSLAIMEQTEKFVSDTLQQLLDALQSNRQTSSSSGGQSKRNQNAFQSLVSGSSSWQFEALISGQSTASVFGSWSASGSTISSNMFDQQMLVRSQTIVANLEIMIEQWEVNGQVDLWSYMQIAGLSDPIVLDLGDEGINLRSAEDGVYFDIKGDGSPVQTAFIQGNNAFLYLDQNGNGIVDDANELFGDHGGYANGFAKLAQYDDNGDGIIDERDAIYSELRLWRDLNGDGVNQASESMSLAEAGIKSLNLKHDNNLQKDAHGNVIGERSSFTRTDGSSGLMADVWLKSL